MKIIAYGDPHGEWAPLLDACAEHRPDLVLIVGDCDLACPIREELAPLWEAGIAVRYVPGNHDNDTDEFWDRLVGDHPTGNLHARVEEIGGVRVAGLHGVFRGQIWYPQHIDLEQREPKFWTRNEYLASVRKTSWHRGWIPRRHLSTIFPEDVDALAAAGPADILVTHEAPTSYRHDRELFSVTGVGMIDEVAEALGARLVVHGHHHHAYSAVLPSGIKVRGLHKAEPWIVEL